MTFPLIGVVDQRIQVNRLFKDTCGRQCRRTALLAAMARAAGASWAHGRGAQGRASDRRSPASWSASCRRAVRGRVDFGVTARALMTMDASNYRRVPLGVVAPRDADDVAAVLAVCRAHGVPVVPRGGGTSIAGQATGTGVVLDFTRHHALARRRSTRRPEPPWSSPALCSTTCATAVAPHGLTFGPDPSTHSRCTLGGMIGNNACGSHSVAWGTTADNVRELAVTTLRRRTLTRLGRGWDGLPDRCPRGCATCVDRQLRTPAHRLPRRSCRAASPDTPWTPCSPSAAPTWPGPSAAARARSACVTEATVRLVEAPPRPRPRRPRLRRRERRGRGRPRAAAVPAR